MNDPVRYDAELAFVQTPKLRVGDPAWLHHAGGWRDVIATLRSYVHADDGIRLVDSAETLVYEGNSVTEPWVGFVHEAPHTGELWFPDLERFFASRVWEESEPFCRGLFVLSHYVKDFVRGRTPVPVNVVPYPCARSSDRFIFGDDILQRDVLHVGEYLRDYQAFFDLPVDDGRKVLLRPEQFDERQYTVSERVRLTGRISDDAYKALLTRAIVFMRLFDATAVTTINECLVRGTPVVVNRLAAVEEYLGAKYPLYYDTLDEAAALLGDSGALRAAHTYLLARAETGMLDPETFVRALQNGTVYRSLPTPRSVEQRPTYDASLILCSYRRVQNVGAILQALSAQRYDGRLQIVVWNNNDAARDALDELCRSFRGVLDLTVIHSSENFLCVVRLAVATLIRSDVLLICDDDVLPSENFVAGLIAKHEEYGANAALCCRGHRFRPHELDDEAPHRVWQEYEHLEFFDEIEDDRQIHFMHADACLIPRQLLLRALAHDWPSWDDELVDDYWLSYVLSHRLGAQIWKVRGDALMTVTPSADDHSVALYHNPRVQAQRVNFYVYHMRNGWPDFGTASTVAAGGTSGACPANPWRDGFAGVNMSLESPSENFDAAFAAGVRVIRVGATDSAVDFRFLVDERGDRFLWDAAAAERLRRGFARAQHAGLSVVLTLNDVPGRLGSTTDAVDLRLWQEERYRQEFVRMWATLAQELRDVENLVGFDVINEPYLAADAGRGSIHEPLAAGVDDLRRLYEETIGAIRAVDPSRTIVVEPSYWGSPEALRYLQPFDDPGVVYSFHMYQPFAYTTRSKNAGRFCYPGMIPEWTDGRWAECRYWDKAELDDTLVNVADWQKRYSVPSSQIYVGEFGVARETRGARRYLDHLIALFAAHRWSWTIYAFRERGWDAMDYELGTDIDSALTRHSADLYDGIAAHFR